MIGLKFGDCLKILPKIESESIDCIITDPPYGIEFQSGYRNVKFEKIENDDNLNWIDMFNWECRRILKKQGHYYCFTRWDVFPIWLESIKKYFKVNNCLVWVKNNTSMGDLTCSYAPQHEFIIFSSDGRSPINGRRDSDVLFFKRTGNIFHPTQKPVDLIEFLIKKSTKTEDVVLDPFCGSGTTLIACNKLNRNFIGIEINPEYYKIAEERLKKVPERLDNFMTKQLIPIHVDDDLEGVLV